MAAASARVPRVLIIAGSDSGGGAGLQADVKACAALGAFATTAVTALTAQDTRGVHGVHAVPAPFVAQQAAVVAADIGVHVVKTGMLPNSGVITAVAAFLAALRAAPGAAHGAAADPVRGAPLLIVDPVMVSASGHSLIDAAAVATLTRELLPGALLVTPNLPEASALLGGRAITTVEDMRAAAADIAAAHGPRAVLLKGGHLGAERSAEVVDVLFDSGAPEGARLTEWREPRIATRNSHGTGCTLATAVAAQLARALVAAGGPAAASLADAALGALLRDAVVAARGYVRAALAASVPCALGAGAHGPMNHSFAVDDYCGGVPAAAGTAAAAAASSSARGAGLKRPRSIEQQTDGGGGGDDDGDTGATAAAGSPSSPPPFDLRLYAVTDARMNARHGRSLVAAVASAIDGGATMVQLREKDAETGAFVAAAQQVMAHVRSLRAARDARGAVRVIINDRLDVCLAAGADGVHVGQSDMPVAAARRLLGRGAIVGVSADSAADAARAQAEGADYLGVGTVFPTATKADAGGAIGVGGLWAVAVGVRIPSVAIGGIHAGNAAAVLAAPRGGGGGGGGVRGVAVVSALFDQPDVAAAAAALRATVDAALAPPGGGAAGEESCAAGLGGARGASEE